MRKLMPHFIGGGMRERVQTLLALFDPSRYRFGFRLERSFDVGLRGFDFRRHPVFEPAVGVEKGAAVKAPDEDFVRCCFLRFAFRAVHLAPLHDVRERLLFLDDFVGGHFENAHQIARILFRGGGDLAFKVAFERVELAASDRRPFEKFDDVRDEFAAVLLEAPALDVADHVLYGAERVFLRSVHPVALRVVRRAAGVEAGNGGLALYASGGVSSGGGISSTIFPKTLRTLPISGYLPSLSN